MSDASLIGQLVKQHEPILWLHEDEDYLPEDIAVMEKQAHLGRKQEGLEASTIVGK